LRREGGRGGRGRGCNGRRYGRRVVLYKYPLPKLLGWLYGTSNGTEDKLGNSEIGDGRDLFIDRDYNTCQIVCEAPSISNVHVRIYSIFGEVDAFVVYMEDSLTNSTLWCYKKNIEYRSRIGRGNAVLLSDIDQIRLCDGSCYSFSALATSTPVE